MYKLILCDDEAEIRQGLKEVVPFEALGFTVVGEAGNGVEALSLCEQLEPDLLVTDIRMPLMDGLTLCRRVREASPATEFLILSGYDDFEYARQAIEIKTMGYLLKPISSQEFQTVLKDAKAQLDEAYARRLNVDRLQAYFRDSLPVLRQTLLQSLLAGDINPEEAVRSAHRYGEQLDAAAWAVALLRPADASGCGIADPELRMFAMRNVLTEALEAHRPYVFPYRDMSAVLLPLQEPDNRAACVALLEEARKTVRHYLGLDLYMGVGDIAASLSAVAQSAKQAQDALEQCLLEGVPQVLFFPDIRPGSSDLRADEAATRRLLSALKAGDQAESLRLLADLLDACRRGHITPKAWQVYLLELFMCLVRAVSELGLPRSGLDGHLDALTRLILTQCPTVDEAQQALSAAVCAVTDAVASQRTTSTRQLAMNAQDYLQKYYGDGDMSLEKLCMHLHISPSYLSTVLKKETRKTFHQLLTELRMDRALTLLSTTEMRTAEIAEKVGLPDPSYFSYCFKKYFGYPPSQARKGR